MRDGERDLVADQSRRVAAAVDVLVVVEDRVRHRAIAVEAPHERSALLRVAAHYRPVLVGEDLGVQDAVGERELADVVQQPGGVREVLIGLVESHLARQRTGVAGDGGGVASGHAVSQRKRLHERHEHAELHRGEAHRARLQLLGAVLRAQQRARQVLEDHEHEHEAQQYGIAHLRVGHGEDHGEHVGGDLAGEHRHEHDAHLLHEGLFLQHALLDRDQREVEQVRRDEHAEDDQRERDRLQRGRRRSARG